MRREAKIATGIDPFDEAIPTTMEWIDDLQKRLGWHDRSMAYLAAKATLHALRDGLPPEEAVFLGGSLPLLLRGAYYEGWHLRDKPLPIPDREAFFERVHDGVNRALGVDPEQVTGCVFELIAARLPSVELEGVKAVTPAALHFLWPGKAE